MLNLVRCNTDYDGFANGGCGRSLRWSSSKMAKHRLPPPALISPHKPHRQTRNNLCCKVLVCLIVLNLLLCAVSFGSDRSVKSQAVGVLVMAHGGDPAWNRAVSEAVKPARQFCPVEIAFGMAQRRSLELAVKRLERKSVKRIAVVRIFVSPESFLHQTQYLLGLRPDPPPFFLHHDPQAGHSASTSSNHHAHAGSERRAPVRAGRPSAAPPPVQVKAEMILNRDGLYDSPLIGEILKERIHDLSRRPEKESILVLAHGEGDDGRNQRWISKLEALVGGVAGLERYRAVKVETLREDWEDKRVPAEARIRSFVEAQGRHGRVLVIPFRVFGFGPYGDVLEGLDHVATRQGLLPHPNVTEWIKQQASDCFSRAGWCNPFTTTESSKGSALSPTGSFTSLLRP